MKTNGPNLDNPGCQNVGSHWIILPKQHFEQIVVSASSVEEFASALRGAGNVNPSGDRFVILADGPQFVEGRQIALSTNISVDWAIEEVIIQNISTLTKSHGSNPNFATILYVMQNTLTDRFIQDVLDCDQSSIIDPLERYKKVRQQQSDAAGDPELFNKNESLLWDMLNEAFPLAQELGTSVFGLYDDGKLQALMQDSQLMALYKELPSATKSQLVELIRSITDVPDYQ